MVLPMFRLCRLCWLFVLCLLFSSPGSTVSFDPDRDYHDLEAGLGKLFAEPMLSGILNWAVSEKMLNNQALLTYATCEENEPVNCLLSHYLNRYKYLQTTYNLQELDTPFIIHSSAALISNTMAVVSICKKPSVPPAFLAALMGCNIIYIASSKYYYDIRGLAQNALEGFFKNGRPVKAQNDYLQLITALLARSLEDSGKGAVETSWQKADSIKVDDSKGKVSITMDELTSNIDVNSFRTGKQLVMQDKAKEVIGFFAVFVRVPSSSSMQIILECQDTHYTLKASHFDLTPLIGLLIIAGTEYIQLLDISWGGSEASHE